MLEKPDLADERIAQCLRDDYGLDIRDIAFLPLGADVNTAVYRVADVDAAYFLKLRRGAFDAAALAVSRLLHDQGNPHIINPIDTRGGALWTRLDEYAASLFPFVAGRDGHAAPLHARHWVELGEALRGMHDSVASIDLARGIPRETFSRLWRDCVRAWQAHIDATGFDDPLSARLAAFMREHRATIDDLLARAERLARILRRHTLDFVLCHADIHAANLLIDADERLYIVDWDTLVFAPRERDLMFVGAGLGIADTPDEAALFYRGYGSIEVDSAALAYYRYQRIVEDIAAFCAEILSSHTADADRERDLGFLMASFGPDDVVERAYRLDASAT